MQRFFIVRFCLHSQTKINLICLFKRLKLDKSAISFLLLGHFLYIGTSTQQHIGQKALLVSSLVTQTTPQCMSFFYILSGDSVGALNIYIMSGAALTNSDVPVWSKRDSQGGTWVPGQTNIQRPSSYRVSQAHSLLDFSIECLAYRC